MKSLAILVVLGVALLLLLTRSSDEVARVLDPDTQITLPAGFDAELLYSVPESQGSWVAMAFDPKGRLIVSDQDDKGVFRVTLPEDAATGSVEVESLEGFPYDPIAWGRRTVGGALGFLCAFDSLYMSCMKGIYRIRDTDGDDQYDDFQLLKTLNVGWEHSAHSIIVTEDGKGLYLVTGNHTRLPDGVNSLQPPVWGLDSLLPAMPDAMGHARGIKAPGGWICRFSPDGEDWTMIASGLRNAVDLAINRQGEMFTFDSDLEFDIGCPWYRPTRINHVTKASEFGWRTGSAKWPDYFADSIGAVVDIGPGSPTGLSFGHHSNFPQAYQDKLFACDWTFGTIYTVDMQESGSSYTAQHEEFLSGTPLNISAMRFGPDGHMYFLVGGRNTASKLYRIRYVSGDGSGNSSAGSTKADNQGLRDIRHSLEAYHGSAQNNGQDSDPGGAAAVAFAFPYLAHEDRCIRYAARIAIENQPLELWRDKALAETNPRAAIYAIIALCRRGEASLATQVLDKLNGMAFDSLDQSDRLALLRAYSLCFIRLGKPGTPESPATEVATTIEKLDALYPATDEVLNTELCRILSYLDAPTVVRKTIALMKATQTKTLSYNREMLARHDYGKQILETMANTPNSQNIHYAYSLRRVQSGWSLSQRKWYFKWLNDTLDRSGGQSFAGYIRAIRQDAIDHLEPGQAATVSYLLGDVGTVDLAELPTPQGPPVAWTVESAMELFATDLRGRDFENGKTMFSAGQCVACHRFRGSGGYAGPDLGSLANRYSIRDIIIAICDPDRSISEQYHASTVKLNSGGSMYGRVIYQNEEELALATNPYDFSKVTKIKPSDLASVEPAQTSLMPAGTINRMNREELMDLMAYLISGGDKKHAVFEPR